MTELAGIKSGERAVDAGQENIAANNTLSVLFLSRLVGRPIQDQQGEKIAVLKDLIVHINGKGEDGTSPEKHPP